MSTSPHWGIERMRPLVQEWGDALRAMVPAYARLVPEAEARQSVLRDPATMEQVAAVEQRLGVRLPPSYRSFLLLSNGANAAGFGADVVVRLFEFNRRFVLPAEDVIAFADQEFLAWLVEMWIDSLGEFVDRQDVPSADAPVDVYDFESGRKALLLTNPEQDGIVGIVPFDGEWQVWEFFHSEVVAHQSFASYLERQARRARRVVAEREERVRAAAADGSSLAEVTDLAESGDPRAVEAACLALLDDRHPDSHKTIAAHALIWMGDSSALPGVRAALAQLRDLRRAAPPDPVDHTADWSRFDLESCLIMALDSCGDPEILAELKGLAAIPESADPWVAKWAQHYLETRGALPRW